MRFACTFLAGLLLGTTLPTESATFKPTNLYLLEAAESFPSNLSTLVSRSGGSLLSVYPEVGLAVARSDSTSFARKMARQSGIARITPDLETQLTPPVDGLV